MCCNLESRRESIAISSRKYYRPAYSNEVVKFYMMVLKLEDMRSRLDHNLKDNLTKLMVTLFSE
jgi:hypothetical protein